MSGAQSRGEARSACLLVALAILAGAPAAHATDVALAAKVRLRIDAKGAKHRLRYQARDAAFAVGTSTDDPLVNGAAAVVFSATDCTCLVMGVAPGTAPGWTSRPANGAPSRWDWRDAATDSRARATSGELRITNRGAVAYGLDATPQGEVEVQVTFGTSADRFCTRFAAPGKPKDDSSTRYESRASIGSCSPLPPHCAPCAPPIPTTSSTSTSSSTSTTTTTSTSLPPACEDTASIAPHCGGTCPPGSVCSDDGNVVDPGCGCFPIGQTTCLASGYPTCGGACLDGQECQSFRQVFVGEGESTSCGCVDPLSSCAQASSTMCIPGACPSGMNCTVVVEFFPEVTVSCGCAP